MSNKESDFQEILTKYKNVVEEEEDSKLLNKYFSR